jgi:protocatechuate 3,4-dioxygenase beta subunit
MKSTAGVLCLTFAVFLPNPSTSWATSGPPQSTAVATTARSSSKRPDIVGVVAGADGKPLAGATLYVSTVAVRKGTSPFCPSCYPDCGKRARSDAQGQFRIPSLDPALTYRLLVVRDGYKPAFVNADPLKGRIRTVLALRPVRAGGDSKEHFVRGTIKGPFGQPVAGAVVEIEGESRGTWTSYGTIEGVDPMAVSDDRGTFRCYVARPGSRYLIKVTARGLAPQKRMAEAPGVDTAITLKNGAALRGSVLDAAGKPMPGVTVHLNQKNRNSETFLGPQQIGTDANGTFLFTNLAPNEEYVVCPAMTDLAKSRLAAPQVTVQVPGDGKTLNDVKLPASSDRTIKGRLRLTDGKAVPPNTRVMLGRDGTWDVQFTEADADGRFQFTGVPAGDGDPLDLSATIRGYKYSKKTAGLEKAGPWIFSVPIKAGLSDITDLEVFFEPGKP